MGWVHRCGQENQAGKIGRRGRPPPLLRLADAKRLHVHKPLRATQVLRLRENRSRSPVVPSGREGLMPYPRTSVTRGPPSSGATGYKTSTHHSLKGWQTASTSAYPRSPEHTHLPTTTQLIPSPTYITPSLRTNSWQAGILAHSHMHKWRPTSAHSSPPHYPSSPKRQSRASTGQCTIFPTPTFPHLKQSPSIPTSTATRSHAPGAPS
jgi:hypothetical protein